jgi:hypothetical protein
VIASPFSFTEAIADPRTESMAVTYFEARPLSEQSQINKRRLTFELKTTRANLTIRKIAALEAVVETLSISADA